jgi:hypothetical protein
MGPLAHSFLDVSGNVSLDSGALLDISLLNGFDPLNQTFSIMDFDNLTGSFSNGSSFWDENYLWNITYRQREIDVTAVQIPEPGSLLLLLVGFSLLALYAQRRVEKTSHLALPPGCNVSLRDRLLQEACSMSDEPTRSFGLGRAVWILASLLVVVALGLHIYRYLRGPAIRFSTPYQAILLTNGSVYFGHLQDYGTSKPVLTDVYYVVSQTNPDTKQVSNSLIKRGKELHEPDSMYINPNQIVFVETVGTNSKVAQLIAQAPR